ncbi:MAG: IclR family transcriptional regulator [Candidatus Protistobacter heckmanni]|nr:IclR family transcriptional regulator [Candidatus Protistobacter heckmanni]
MRGIAHHDYLRHDAALGKYSLDAGVLALGHAYLAHHGLTELLRRHMLTFAKEHGVSVSLGRCDGADMIYLESVRSEGPASLGLGAGSRLALLSSSMGRAWLASLEDAPRKALLARIEKTLPEVWAAQAGAMQRAVDAAHKAGYALSLREWHPGIDACAVAFVAVADGERYALSCSLQSAPDRAAAKANLRERQAPAARQAGCGGYNF